MKTLLVATDFSSAANNAAIYAAEMAADIDACLLLLHVYHVPIIYSDVPTALGENEIKEQAATCMQTLKQHLVNHFIGHKAPVILTDIKMGHFIEQLEAVCIQVNPFLVFMGNNGSSAIGRLLLGSNTFDAARLLKWPVLMVPSGAKYLMVKKIGLACDFFEMAEAATIEKAKQLQEVFHAPLHVLHVGINGRFAPEVGEGTALIDELLQHANHTYHFIKSLNEEEGIIEFAQENHLDFLIIFPKDRNMLERIFHKSFTKELLLHSPIPVLVMH